MNKITFLDKVIISTMIFLYLLTSLISTWHALDFFMLSNPKWMSWTLSIAFEIGCAASMFSIIILDRTSKILVWSLFITLTLFQMMCNTYFAYSHLESFNQWIELFDLIDSDIIEQKRILSIISGAILPLIALGFIKSLVDYLKPNEVIENEQIKNVSNDSEIKGYINSNINNTIKPI
jgi:uncharacterized membrane protein